VVTTRRGDGIPTIPEDFDETVDWFEHLSSRLVLLADFPLADLERAVLAFEARVGRHVREFASWLDTTNPAPGRVAEARALLRADHAWFGTSTEQLGWFFRIVASEDHGGHRQALGQYGRVFTESLRRHRVDERAYLEAAPPGLPARPT
jgi:hypothetical protein